MRNFLKLACLVVLVVCAVAPPVMADMTCVPGYKIINPITGQMVDCLEDGGYSCLSCRELVIVR